MTIKKTKHIPASLTLALLMSDPCMAAEKLNDTKLPAKNTKEATSVSKASDAIELKPMTVVGEAMQDPNDPHNKSYTVTNSSTATKTDTPIMETATSVQVVPRTVLDDQKATRITDALENVSGVRPQPSLGIGSSFIIRGFKNDNIYRNGLRANNIFPQEYDTANLQSVEVLKGPAQLYGRTEPGGLISLTTKKPLDIPYYSLEQRFGSYDLYRTEWDATGPVTSDKSLLYRFTGSYQNNNSFRDFVSNDRSYLRPASLGDPLRRLMPHLNSRLLIRIMWLISEFLSLANDLLPYLLPVHWAIRIRLKAISIRYSWVRCSTTALMRIGQYTAAFLSVSTMVIVRLLIPPPRLILQRL